MVFTGPDSRRVGIIWLINRPISPLPASIHRGWRRGYHFTFSNKERKAFEEQLYNLAVILGQDIRQTFFICYSFDIGPCYNNVCRHQSPSSSQGQTYQGALFHPQFKTILQSLANSGEPQLPSAQGCIGGPNQRVRAPIAG